jgi:hypothetical protein
MTPCTAFDCDTASTLRPGAYRSGGRALGNPQNLVNRSVMAIK